MHQHALALVTTLAFTGVASAEAPRHAWDGFEAGASVVLERVENAPGRDPVLTRQQLTLSSESKGRIWVSFQELEASGEQGAAYSREMLLWETPESLRLQLGSVRDATVQIGGRTLACEVAVYMGQDLMNRGSLMLELWSTTELTVPVRNLSVDGYEVLLGADVVKVEWELDMGGGELSSCGANIAKLEQPRMIGDQELICFYESGSVLRKLPGGQIEGLMQRWLSDEVPGHIVREETITTFDDRQMSTTLEATAFTIPTPEPPGDEPPTEEPPAPTPPDEEGEKGQDEGQKDR